MDGDERYRWRHGAHRWRRGIDPKPGRHKRPSGQGLWDDIRTFVGALMAGLVVFGAVGVYLVRHSPNGQLQPRLPGIYQQVPGAQESAIERLQASGDPPAASRGRARTQTPAPVLSREPGTASTADRSSSPAVEATQTPDGDTKAEGPITMPSTACPPPLPPKPKKTKAPKGKPAKVLTVFPTASPSTSPEGLKPERTGPAG